MRSAPEVTHRYSVTFGRFRRQHPICDAPPRVLIRSESGIPLLGRKERAAGPTMLGGRYSLGRRLGQGGSGTVYETDGPLGERLAVKVLAPARGSGSSSGSARSGSASHDEQLAVR